MAIHLYKTSTLSTRNGTVDSQVKILGKRQQLLAYLSKKKEYVIKN